MIDPNHPFYAVVGLYATYKLFLDRKAPNGAERSEKQED